MQLTSPKPHFTIVIQAGGESRRMGRDKGLLPFLGEPLILRVLRRVERLADEVLVTTNHPEGYHFLNIPLIPDRLPGTGALGGLYTALSASSASLVGVIACDMPFVNPDLLQAEKEILQSGPFAAIVPRHSQGIEPFHAVYRPETCLPVITHALEQGKRRVDAWFDQVMVHYLPETEIQRLDPDRLAFLNVNTPEEVLQAEKQNHLANVWQPSQGKDIRR